MLSLIVNVNKPKKTGNFSKMQPLPLTVDEDNPHLIDLSLGKMDYKELMQLSKKQAEQELHDYENQKSKKPMIQELNAIDFTEKSDMNNFTGFKTKEDSKKIKTVQKEFENSSNNFDKITSDLKNLHIESSDYSFGFLNKFSDYFENLQVWI